MLKKFAHHVTCTDLNHDFPTQLKDDFDSLFEQFQDVFRPLLIGYQ